MNGLPKKYAKMGFKKGWRLFKASSSKTKTKKIKTKTRFGTMARKRRFGKRSSSSKGFGMNKIVNVAIGVAGVALYEVFISPMIPLSTMIKNIVELVVGIILIAMPKIPSMLKAVGGAMVTINAFQLIYPLIAGMGSSSSGNSTW